MKHWDYKQIDDRKIRSIYLHILSRRTKQKFYTIAHPSFNKMVTQEILDDLMSILSLNEEQANWLFQAHTKKEHNLKKQLLLLEDPNIDLRRYQFFDFLYRAKKGIWIGIILFSLFFLFGILIRISIETNQVGGDITVGTWVSSFLYLFGFIGLGTIFLYYRPLIFLKKDVENNRIQTIDGQVIKVKLKSHMKYLQDRGQIDFIFFGVELVIKGNTKRVKLLYPLVERETTIMSHSRIGMRRRRLSLLKSLRRIEVFKGEYYSVSKVIATPIPAIDSTMYKNASDLL